MTGRYPNAANTDSIRTFTLALADLGEQAPPNVPVPTCGEWTLDDLLWHLTEVQHFWTFIIENRPADYTGHTPCARTTGKQLLSDLRAGVQHLTAALDASSPTDAAWSWAAEQTVGFTIRRQTHEALTHYIDGVLAVGADMPPVDAELAADGIDEMIMIMLGGAGDATDFAAGSPSVRLESVDTADSWQFTTGARDGSPEVVMIDSAAAPDVSITGSALDLNLWLWGRADMSSLTITGDESAATALRQTIAGKV